MLLQAGKVPKNGKSTFAGIHEEAPPQDGSGARINTRASTAVSVSPMPVLLHGTSYTLTTKDKRFGCSIHLPGKELAGSCIEVTPGNVPLKDAFIKPRTNWNPRADGWTWGVSLVVSCDLLKPYFTPAERLSLYEPDPDLDPAEYKCRGNQHLETLD